MLSPTILSHIGLYIVFFILINSFQFDRFNILLNIPLNPTSYKYPFSKSALKVPNNFIKYCLYLTKLYSPIGLLHYKPAAVETIGLYCTGLY